MDISIPYYEDKTRISNSNIGWFLNKGPAYLHKMLTEDVPEEKNPVLERGTMIHEYILQPEEFQKDYVVWDKSRPSSAQQEKFCQELASSVEIEPNKAVLSAYKEAYSTAGKSEDKMLSEGLKIASTLKDYIDFLKANDGRIMISPWDVKMLEKIKQNILHHKAANNIIWPLGHIGDYSVESYGETKDVKLWHFEDSIDMYDYCRQLAYYSMAARWYLVNECGVTEDDIFEWEFEYYIIGIDTTGSYEIRVFKVEPYMVQSRYNIILDALTAIAWHQKNNKWDHSREYYEGDGCETLDL